MRDTIIYRPWEAVFRRIRALYRPDWWYPPRTTPADLDAAEKELGFRFPASYRAFALEFGLGGDLLTLPAVLPLFQPPNARESHWFCSVVAATRFHRSYAWKQDPTLRPFYKRVVVFAIEGGYHTFVFDPQEVTDSRLAECRIYDINRLEEAVPIATSFGDWLAWIDENYRFDCEEEEAEVELCFEPVSKPDSPASDPMTYWPHSIRAKKPPANRRLKLWLEWKNGLVGALARSIRDEGQTDVFPILADALEEAGCENQDLINACRQGDPDIDGVWALQVLLDEE
jgi:SMI1 / KNR4 family (SUKH-1)